MATMGLECVIIACSHGNRANPVVSCAKFEAHTNSMATLNNPSNTWYSYYLTMAVCMSIKLYTTYYWISMVAMATGNSSPMVAMATGNNYTF